MKACFKALLLTVLTAVGFAKLWDNNDVNNDELCL
jgi:hypothetical protein